MSREGAALPPLPLRISRQRRGGSCGRDNERFHPGDRPGHHVEPGDPVRRGHEGGRRRPEGVHPALPRFRLGRARPGGDLVERGLDREDGIEKGRASGRRSRRHRHHQPARDRRHLGARDRQADPSGNRVAGPAHGAAVREAEKAGPRAEVHPQDRAAARSLFLGHQDRLDAGQGEGRAPPRREGRVAGGHHRFIPDLASYRRQGARHRRHQRLAHAGL